MRVEQLGDGEPELVVIGGIHGDEPSGVRAIERVLADDPALQRPVKFIVANELALEQGVRYVDADLNRAFTDDTPTDAHERQLAKRLADEVAGSTVLAIHSTQSHAEPFALCSRVDQVIHDVVPFLSVVALVDLEGFGEGRIFATDADIVEVEAGLQGTEQATENAYDLVREFLTATDALAGDTVPHDLPVFQLGNPIEKPPADEYEVFVENFEEVEAGEPFAAADGEALVTTEPFTPILLSAYGYRDVFGYPGRFVGTLHYSSDGANSTIVRSRSSAQ
jgi:hypothetical protein